MSRRRKVAVALLSALALGAACEVAHAQPNEPAAGHPAVAPPYTLEVDSNAPEVVSFEALAARIGSDLGAAVVRPGAAAASRAAITIRYRGREIVVRAIHSGGRVLERTVQAEGDDAAVQREAVLLAANLARDEAREILDALAARPAPPVSDPKPSPAPAPPPKQTVDEGRHPISFALFFPLATNFARPNVTSNVNLSLFYGRVGTASGAQLGDGVVYASRKVEGVQIGAGATAAGGPVAGAQLGGAGNIALEGIAGAQVGGAFNVSRGSVTGVQLTGGLNIATRDVTGVQLAAVNVAESVEGVQAGVINIARKVRGTQLGVINIAEEVDGASIGLISISRDSIHPIVWASNLEYTNAGVKFSTKYVYTIAAIHYGTLETGFHNFGTTAVVGGHVPLPVGFDVEIQGALTNLVPRPSERPKEGNRWVAPQVIAGYSFAPHLRVFAGGGVRVPLSVDIGREVKRPEVLAGVQF